MLWNSIMNRGLESLAKHDRDARTARELSTKKQLLEYVKAHRGCKWCAKQRAWLDVWLGWICRLLSLDILRKEEVLIRNSKERALTTGVHCLGQSGRNDFEAVAPARSSRFVIIVNRKKGSSIKVFPRFHAYEYYLVPRIKKLASTMYMQEVTILPLSVIVGHRYLQHGGLKWN